MIDRLLPVSLVLDRPQLARGASDVAMRQLFPVAHPYADDPVGYCRDVLGFEPWSKQRAVLEAVRDHRRVAVRSCHGAGKTAIAARAALWWLAAHPGDTRVITTGLSWQNVRDQLWKEIHAAHRASGLGGNLSETRLDLGEKRFAVGLSTDKPERFQGHHADHLLLIVDEASGLDERIFEAAAGYLTNPEARLLLIGNPTQLAGEFHAAFHRHRGSYATIHISAHDTPAFTGENVPASVRSSIDLPDWVDEMRILYGEDSAAWQVRVLGDFPSTTDDTVISLSAIEAAQARKVAPGQRRVVACDVARFGSDETVIVERKGNRARIAAAYHGQDLMGTVGRILRVARELDSPDNNPMIIVDDAGLGGGVVDRLREINEFPVVAFNGGNTAYVDDDYPNRRSEVWFAFEQQLPNIDLDEDEQLAADLVAPRYRLDSRGRRVVEAKSETKKRLGRSPDRADAVLMAFAAPARFEFAPGVPPVPALTIDVERKDLW